MNRQDKPMEKKITTIIRKKHSAVVVAHPDDETLWCGGEILMYPNENWFVVSLCRKNDPDRAPKFKKALSVYGAKGVMGDLDDAPEQLPLSTEEVKKAILNLLPQIKYDLIITHSPFGEYTRHLRHEEIGRAVISLWNEHKIETNTLWLFAYEDGNKEYYPRAVEDADYFNELPINIWKKKWRIITEIYGFEKSGFEAKTTLKSEAFWQFNTPKDAIGWFEAKVANQS